MRSIGQKLIIISFVLAALATVLVWVGLKPGGNKSETSKKTTVLVATETIPPRTLVEKKMVKEIQVDDNAMVQEYIKDSSEVIGKYTKDTIYKNEGFYKDKLISEAGEELSLKIGGDNRAISVNVTGDSGVSYLIKPGDFVDIVSYLGEKKDGQKVVRPDSSKIILQNIEVLALDKQLDRGSKAKDQEKIPNTFLVTLSVPTNEVEKLVLAESIGTLKLALRPMKNDAINETNGATADELTIEFNKNEKASQEVKANVNTTNESNSSNEKYINYTVKEGDTLKEISRAFYGDPEKYLIIKEANNIEDENLVLINQMIKVPILDK